MSLINKIEVTKGVFWIDINQVGFRLLCGCPADSVKHLMKRGLVINKEVNGVSYEDGPNSILLSDVMVQNGDFANLAEFPVLQMLYRQGMIIPKHPNNNGSKPLLLGSKEQIFAQLDYIYRGNYGLISKEEILNCGVSEEFASELMQIKLNFAFGKIKSTQEFIDHHIISDEICKIRDGITIKRIKLNVFTISYQNEEVVVDLNLYKDEKYPLPYPIGHYNIKREYFAVIHSGQGDGWDINRPSMSSIILFHGKIYLIDAGANISYTLNALGIGINEIEGIFHTHSHDDHFCGLATLIQCDHKIKYYATPLVRSSVMKKLSALLSFDEKSFYDYFDTVDLPFDEWSDIEGLEVKPIFSPHPVETNIYIFRSLGADGYKTYGHYADITSFDVMEKVVPKDLRDITIEHYLEPLDLKKIDVGGGMIHGNAIDFKDDTSKKIILAHTSTKLSNVQKEIGSGAPFGTIDILIPDYQDFLRKNVYHFLHQYIPSVEAYKLRVLMNNPVEIFNSESILIKEGEINQYIYLLLSGNVEMIQTQRGVHNHLSSGAIIGEISGLNQIPALETYITKSFVQALRIPSSTYIEFVTQNGIYGRIEQLKDKREFLQRTQIFGENISYPVLNSVCENLLFEKYKNDEIVNLDFEHIYIVKKGTIERGLNNKKYEEISDFGYFGEEYSFFDFHIKFTFKAINSCEIYKIPIKLIDKIPIIRWKLFESYRKRLSLFFGDVLIVD